jgi:metal-responsive CopG/Arc/MetJ family transcriptional regulator
MKTAVSVPDKVFQEAERLAARTKKSRSQLFSLALAEYVARHAPEYVTEAQDRTCAEVGEVSDDFVFGAARRVLEHSEW